MDCVEIKDLRLRTIVGTNDWERVTRQDVVIHLSLFTDTRAAGVSDNLEDAVDYDRVSREVAAMVENSQFCLLEKMAAEVARVCLADARVERARVHIEKPGAVRYARCAAVTIDRSRDDFANH